MAAQLALSDGTESVSASSNRLHAGGASYAAHMVMTRAAMVLEEMGGT